MGRGLLSWSTKGKRYLAIRFTVANIHTFHGRLVGSLVGCILRGVNRHLQFSGLPFCNPLMHQREFEMRRVAFGGGDRGGSAEGV